MRHCVATCHAHAPCFSVSSLVGICTSLPPRVPYDGMGLSMETVLDSSRIDDGSKCDPGEDNLQTSPNTTESAKLLRSGRNYVTLKQ